MKRRATLWQKRAGELAGLLPKSRFHPAVLAWAEERPARDRWAVAFSGGSDSTALLLLLWAHWPEHRERLMALHFDHDLRGRESRGDAGYCRRVCAGLGVSLAVERWAKRTRSPSEAEARAGRFEFFDRSLRSRHRRALWLGHQQDDIAETLLMRIARGSGAAGLAAPRPVHEHQGGRVHLRPLLALKKAEIEAALRAVGAGWRQDSSNSHGEYFRNRVRNSVLPAWVDAAGRDALGGAALSRELLEEDDRALESWVDSLQPVSARGDLDVVALAGRPRAVVRRALHRWLVAQNGLGALSRAGFDRLLEAVEAGRATRQSLGSSVFAVIKKGRLGVQRR
jgi:tRNA(Ile)-lysidine synthase